MCGLGAVGASSIFGLVRRSGSFTTVLPTFVLVSRMQLAPQDRDNDHFLNTTSSSRRKQMVTGALTRGSVVRVGLGVGGTVVTSGSRDRPSHSCDGWVCELGGRLIDIWVGTWVRGFHCGDSDFCFSFKNPAGFDGRLIDIWVGTWGRGFP